MSAIASALKGQYVWQYSLRSLMFVTMVVAVCAAIVRMSPLCALFFVPVLAAGLLRTVRIQMSMAGPQATPAPRLFVVFCQSVGLIVSFLLVSLTAVAAAGAVAVYLVIVLAGHIVRAAHKVYWPTVKLAARTVQAIWRRRGQWGAHRAPGRIDRRLAARSVAGMLWLFALSRQLFRQCCDGWLDGPLASRTSSASRGEPL